MQTRDEMLAELIEIEALLSDTRIAEELRTALYGAQQALRWAINAETWECPSQTFYLIGARPIRSISVVPH